MTVVAVVPARAGSKGIVDKNLRTVAGRSLIARSVVVLQSCPSIERIYVSTDGPEIAAEAERHGASVIMRPEDLASDTASSEGALIHALETIGHLSASDQVVFAQCTSPFVDPETVERAISRVRSGEYASVFSAVPFHGFVWRTDGGAEGVNHEAATRLRRQDRPAEWLETGAFYVMDVAGFLERRHRFFGRVGVEPVDSRHAIEIDEPDDLRRAQAMAADVDPLGPAALDGRQIRALVMDFDGVHTDDRAALTSSGEESAVVSRSDGMGIALAKRAGLALLIISKERVPIVERRADKLGIECISGCDNKLRALRHWADEREVSCDHIAYVGNDVNDVACLRWVAWPIVVADAHPSLLLEFACVTRRRGGTGAVREIIDAIIASTNDQIEKEL
ncbi:MAG: acylneuraminate cytidylyltransferase [Actinomycetota bacterium]